MQDDAGVLAANEEFYRAFESYDLPRMERLWVQAERSTCVHPGWQLLRGWADIRESWLAIFTGLEVLRFTLSDVRPHRQAALAWVTLHENIRNGPGPGRLASTVLATNVFERGDDGLWRIVHHHASHVLRRAPIGPRGRSSEREGTGGDGGGAAGGKRD
jgi:ketosteroid isomerase-like protein